MSSKIPVVYLIDKLHRAGAQNNLRQLAAGLDRSQFDVQVCTLIRGGPMADWLREQDIPVTVLGAEPIYHPRSRPGFRQLVNLLREQKVQILHTYLASSNIFGTFAALKAKTPLIYTARRDTGFSRNWRLGLVEEWLVNPKVTRTIAVSEAAAIAARDERGLNADRVSTILNGIELDRWTADRTERDDYCRRLAIDPANKNVALVANYNPIKGHREFLEAIAMVVKERPDTHFFLVGEGPLRDDLESQLKNLDIVANVELTGSREDLPEFLAAMDIAVLASHTEGMSNALMEYMASSLPSVVTDVGGNPELISHERTGLLVQPSDPNAMAQALLRLLTNHNLAKSLGEQARHFVETEMSVGKMVQRHQDLYISDLNRLAD
ncbi:MAG: glycosyltransferase [Pseudomonadales bacterium]